MTNEIFQLINAYQNLSSNNQELIDLASKEIIFLTSKPTILNSLFEIVEKSPNNFIRKEAAVSIQLVIIKFKDQYSVEEIQNIFGILLKFLSTESLEVIQNIFCDTVYLLLSDETMPVIISFFEKSPLDFLKAKLLISFPDKHLEPFIPFFEPIINKLINSDINGILLGFRIRPYIDPALFLQIFQKAVEMSIFFSNNSKVLSEIISSINQSIEYVPNKMFILNLYMPMIGFESNVSSNSQLLYASTVTEVIETSTIEDVQLIFSILHKYIQLYIIEDDYDIFDFISSFSSNSEFLEALISKFEVFESNEKSLNALILCLSHLFSASMNANTNFVFIEQISVFLSKVLSHPSKLVRETAGKAIQNFSFDLEENILEVSPLLVNSIISSLEVDHNVELVEGLASILQNCSNDDDIINSFFDRTFSFLMEKIQKRENLQSIYPAFVALCAASRSKSREYFEQISGINNSVVVSDETSLALVKEFAIKGLSNLTIMCSELFVDKISDIITFFIQIMTKNSDESDIVIAALSAIGPFMSKFAKNFDFQSLIPFLAWIVDADNEASSLALSTICSIMNEFHEKADFSGLIPAIIGHFNHLYESLIESRECETLEPDKPLLNLLRAMTLFVCYIDYIPLYLNMKKEGENEGQTKNKSELYDFSLNWTLRVLNQTDDNEIISGCLDILIELVDYYFFEPLILFPFFKKIFDKQYDDFLFTTFSFFLKNFIRKGASFDEFVPYFFEMANSSSQVKIRDFGLQILGQIAENKRGKCINGEFIKNLLSSSLQNIASYESSSAVFVLFQLVDGCSDLPEFSQIFNPIQIMGILLEYLKSDKKTPSFLNFADNCVTTFAKIVMKIVKNAVPFDSYLEIVLNRIPARFSPEENFEMLHFFLWIGNQTNFNPPDLFLAVLIRFFSNPMDPDVVGFIANDTDEYINLINTLKNKTSLLMSRVENVEEFVSTVCSNDPYKINNVQLNLINRT